MNTQNFSSSSSIESEKRVAEAAKLAKVAAETALVDAAAAAAVAVEVTATEASMADVAAAAAEAEAAAESAVEAAAVAAVEAQSAAEAAMGANSATATIAETALEAAMMAEVAAAAATKSANSVANTLAAMKADLTVDFKLSDLTSDLLVNPVAAPTIGLTADPAPTSTTEEPSNIKSGFGACLVPLLDALGWQGNSQNLMDALPIDLGKIDGDDLLNIMANLKFECTEKLTNLQTIDLRQLPCIFQKNKNVYVLLKHSNGAYIVFDGNKQDFAQLPGKSSVGKAFFFNSKDSDNIKLLGPQKNWFRQVLMRFNKMLLIGVFLTFILSIFSFLSPLLVMMIYDKVMVSETGDILTYLGSGILLLLIGDLGTRFLRSHLFAFASFRIGNIVGNEVIRRLLFLPPEFTETTSTGSQISRIKDFDSVQDLFSGAALFSLFDLPFIFLLILGMVVIGGSLAFVPLIAVLLFFLLGLFCRSIMHQAVENASITGSKRHEFLIHLSTNYRAIKLTGASQIWSNEFRNISAASVLDSYAVAKINSFISVTTQLLVSATGLATITVGIFKVLDNQMTSGALMTSVLLVWRILAPLRSGFGVLTQIGRIKKSIAQIDKLMTLRLESKQEEVITQGNKVSGHIAFDRVFFRYKSDANPALLGISFDIKPGQILVVTGANGCGKTTILKLILGLYKPQAGQVMLDENNVRQIDPIALRKSIAYAPQQGQIYEGTIAGNLRLANSAATLSELEDATRRAGILDEINQLEHRMDTPIDPSSLFSFSPSFSRSLILAQLYLQDSKLLLIDDPEQRLDNEKLEALVDELKELKKDHTLILATNRTNFFNIADHILWLDHGRTKMYGPAKEITQKYFAEKAKMSRR